MSAQVHLCGLLLVAFVHTAFNYDIVHRYEFVNVQGTLLYQYQEKIISVIYGEIFCEIYLKKNVCFVSFYIRNML